VWVAGGAAVYEAALPHADAQLLSEIDLEPDGDTFYPAYAADDWLEASREHHEGYDVVRLERARAD
jgi:dihydrofolate reductase